jgi:hypothetical protein
MQKHQDGFYQLELKAHFDNYQTHVAQIKHELAEQENQRDESRFFDMAVYRSNDQILDSVIFAFFGIKFTCNRNLSMIHCKEMLI